MDQEELLFSPSLASPTDPLDSWPWAGQAASPPRSFKWPSSDRNLAYVEVVGEGIWARIDSPQPLLKKEMEELAMAPLLRYAQVPLFNQGRGAWVAVADAQQRYKKLLRSLFYLKDSIPDAPRLVMGTYLSGQGVVRAPLPTEGWGLCPVELGGYETAGAYPFEVLLCHLEPPSSFPVPPSIPATYLTNETNSFGTTKTPKRLAFERLEDVFLAPTLLQCFKAATPTSPEIPEIAEGYNLFRPGDFQRARWKGGPDSRCGLVAYHNRATVNLANPYVRRWWTEKALSYLEEVQRLASEAVSEYLSPPLSSSDPYYYPLLQEKKPALKHMPSKHLGWLHSFVDLDNLAPRRPVPLSSSSTLCDYFHTDPDWKQSVNSWPFVAAFLFALRKELRRRWGMGVLINTTSPVDLCRFSEGLRSGYDYQFWMLKPTHPDFERVCSGTPLLGVSPVCFPASLRYLQQHGGAAFSTYKPSELWPETVLDGFNFEQTFPLGRTTNSHLPPQDAYHPRRQAIVRKDGTLVKTATERDAVDARIDMDAEAYAQTFSWWQAQMKRGVAFLITPQTRISPTKAENDQNLPAQDRLVSTRYACALAWMLRSAGDPLFVRLVPSGLAFSQSYDQFEFLQFFRLPLLSSSWLRPPQFKPTLKGGEPLLLSRQRNTADALFLLSGKTLPLTGALIASLRSIGSLPSLPARYLVTVSLDLTYVLSFHLPSPSPFLSRDAISWHTERLQPSRFLPPGAFLALPSP